MKNLFVQISCAALISLSIISCSKDDDNTNSKKDYSDAVADEIAASSSNLTRVMTGTSDSYSECISSQTKTAVLYGLKSASLDTVFQKKKSFTNSSTELDPYTFSFTYNVHFGLVNKNGDPDNLFYNSDVVGNYEGAIINASISENCNWVLTGLNATSDDFILNGTGVLKSNSTNKVREDVIVSTSNVKFQNVTYDKITDEITGGTLNWNISGTVNGESFNYEAVLILTSDRKAELTLSNKKYYINISTGEVE